MLWVILGLIFCTVGCGMIYLASPNQQWLSPSSPLSEKATLTLRYTGLFLGLLALVFTLQDVSLLSGFFIWLTAIMTVSGLLPFMSFLKKS